MDLQSEMLEKNLSELSEDEKKQYLFIEQKKTLDSFLKRNAISKQQYDKSLGDLKTKMGIKY